MAISSLGNACSADLGAVHRAGVPVHVNVRILHRLDQRVGGRRRPVPGGAFLHARQQGPGRDPGRGASRVGVSQREDHSGIGTGVERRVQAGVEERRAAGRAVVLADDETVQGQV